MSSTLVLSNIRTKLEEKRDWSFSTIMIFVVCIRYSSVRTTYIGRIVSHDLSKTWYYVDLRSTKFYSYFTSRSETLIDHDTPVSCRRRRRTAFQ